MSFNYSITPKLMRDIRIGSYIGILILSLVILGLTGYLNSVLGNSILGFSSDRVNFNLAMAILTLIFFGFIVIGSKFLPDKFSVVVRSCAVEFIAVVLFTFLWLVSACVSTSVVPRYACNRDSFVFGSIDTTLGNSGFDSSSINSILAGLGGNSSLRKRLTVDESVNRGITMCGVSKAVVALDWFVLFAFIIVLVSLILWITKYRLSLKEFFSNGILVPVPFFGVEPTEPEVDRNATHSTVGDEKLEG